MSQRSVSGRHRADSRHTLVFDLPELLRRTSRPALKITAGAAVAGGLIAASALPSQAAPELVPASFQVAPSAPALVSPSATRFAPSYGAPVVTVKAKPKPKPKPVKAKKAKAKKTTKAPAAPKASAEATPASSMMSAAAAAQAAQVPDTAPVTSTPAPAPAPSTPSPAPAAASGDVLSVARSLLGIPDVFGGTTPAGFDCSGFTSYVFSKVGKSLPRTASQQQAVATRVSNPQPGDLVFYGFPAYHVGIYAGNGVMIDSPRTGKSTSERNMWSGPVSYGRI